MPWQAKYAPARESGDPKDSPVFQTEEEARIFVLENYVCDNCLSDDWQYGSSCGALWWVIDLVEQERKEKMYNDKRDELIDRIKDASEWETLKEIELALDKHEHWTRNLSVSNKFPDWIENAFSE